MKFLVNTLPAVKQHLDCLILGVFDNADLTMSAKEIDAICGQKISRCMKEGDFNGKLGTTLLLPHLSNLPDKRILVVGCGEAAKLNEKNYQQIVSTAFLALANTRYQHIGFYLSELNIPKRDVYWLVREAILRYFDAVYRYENYKSSPNPTLNPESLVFYAASAQDMASCEDAIREGQAIGNAMQLTRDLGNMPCNDCTPAYLAMAAEKLAKQFSAIKTRVYDQHKLEKMGFGAFVAVAQGSEESGKLIIMEYRGADKSITPFALVGKGITFDTGGLSLKPAASMLEMKFDMCGAATVLGVMQAVAELKLPINVVGALAAAENMPDGKACKPESIVKTLSGLTVEITNTDAEGRLVLCDTLTYIENEYKPRAMIDIATLTGGVIVALGRVMAGLFSSNETLTDELKLAAQQAFDPVWQLPICDDYKELMESSTADMVNSAAVREAHAGTAAYFLSRFVKSTPWAHLDIAGVANISGSKKSATGRSVPLLVQFLLNRAKQVL